MMQSLLLNGAASIKNNDLKNQDENDTRINSLKNSKLAEQQRNFAKVLQNNIDKESAIAQSRHTARKQNFNNNSRLENTSDQAENKNVHDKTVNENKSSQKMNGHEEDKKSVSTDSKKVDKNELLDDDKQLAKIKKEGESKVDESKSNDLFDLPELALDTEQDSKLLNAEERGESEKGGDKLDKVIDSSSLELNTDATLDSLSDSDLLEQLSANLNAEDTNENNVELDDSEAKLSELPDSEIELVDPDLVAMNTNPVVLNTTTQQNEQVTSEDAEETLQKTTAGPVLDSMGQSSLLSQIEAAQQADTKVKNKEGEDSSEITMSMLKNQSNLVNNEEKNASSLSDEMTIESDSDIEGEIDGKAKLTSDVEADVKTKNGAELETKVDTEAEKKPKLKLDSDVNVAKETDNVESDSDLDTSLQSLKPVEKLDQLSTLIKNETAVTNQTAIDANGARPNQNNPVQLDKLVAFNQQAPATNNLLQEPLDIQSKHAAAMMGERVMMMLSQGKQEVEIRLDPAELGSMFIKMQVKQDQVQLHIQTQAGLSKDIIEQNMPRLREQLAQQGIQLNEANVQQQSQQQSQQQQKQNQINSGSRQLTNAQEVVNDQKNVFIPSKIPSLEQGIDYYA